MLQTVPRSFHWFQRLLISNGVVFHCLIWSGAFVGHTVSWKMYLGQTFGFIVQNYCSRKTIFSQLLKITDFFCSEYSKGHPWTMAHFAIDFLYLCFFVFSCFYLYLCILSAGQLLVLLKLAFQQIVLLSTDSFFF